MSFLIFDYTDYKIAIKHRIKDLKQSKPKFSIQYLAESLSIQYTFLSKVLNSATHHLNEDQVYSAGKTLEFLSDEVDFLLLLRSHQATQNKSRKDELFARLTSCQNRNRLSLNRIETQMEQHQSIDEIKYLLDYHAHLIHAALSIKSIQKDPMSLANHLHLSSQRVKEILLLLNRLGRIEFDEKTNQVKKLINSRIHFGKEHPLTRAHQLAMKTALTQLSFSRPEEAKENLFVTFTTDANGFEKIKKQIRNLSSEVQKTAFENKHTGVFQMNLDFVQII